jgi:hypothetical protein
MADEFELFDTGDCAAELPVETVLDQYTFVRFARLRELDPSKPTEHGSTVVLPRDLVNPRLVDKIRRELFYYPAHVVKGGVALKSGWDEVVHPPKGDDLKPADAVRIDDLGQFFSSGEVELDNVVYKADLTPSNVFDLRTAGVTQVFVGGDADRRLVRVHAPDFAGDVHEGGVLAPLDVGTLDAFLAHPAVLLGGAEHSIALGEQNVRDLATAGMTEVSIGEGGATQRVVIRVEDVGAAMSPLDHQIGPIHSAGGGAVASTSYAVRADNPAKITGQTLRDASPIDPRRVDELISRDFMSRLDFVLYLPYRQTWTLQGYARGELLNTISLGPEEETTIEVVSWDRYVRSTEDIVTTEQESTYEIQMTDKRSREIVKQLTKDSNWSFSIGGGVTLPAGDLPVNVSANYDAGESLRDFSGDTRSFVKEAVQRASTRFKTTHQTKVVETHEFGSETRTTRKLRNPNMCHALDLDYFEVVAGYDVTTALDVPAARLCVLTTQFLPGEIDDLDFMLSSEDALRESLLAPSLYAQAFDALHTLLAWKAICDVKCGTHCPCDAVVGTPKPTEAATTAAIAGDELAKARALVTSSAGGLRTAISAVRAGEVDSICKLANDVGTWSRYVGIAFWNPMSASEKSTYEAAWDKAKASYRRYLYAKAMEVAAPRFWQSAAEYQASNDSSPEALDRFLTSANPAAADILNVMSIQLRLGGAVLATVTDLIKSFCLNLKPLQDNFAFDNAGLDGAFSAGRAAMQAFRQASAPPAASEPSGAGGGESPAAAAAAIKQATTEWSDKEIASARVEVEALRHHLRRNESYYRQAIWRRLDPGDRYVAMAGLGDILKYVDTNPLGFVGKAAVLPFRLEADDDLKAWFETNVVKNADLKKPEQAFSITVPTGGVTVTGRLGSCDLSEEFIAEHRRLDLAEKAAQVKVADELAKQAALESSRREARLKADELDPFELPVEPS